MRLICAILILPVLLACGERAPTKEAPDEAVITQTEQPTEAPSQGRSLVEVLAAQPADVQARYAHRHPQETLEFVGIEPGMRVVEALPGGGWYSKLLVGVLGEDGELVGADYPITLWPNFGFANEEFMAKKATWLTDWVAQAQAWRQPGDAEITAFVMNELPVSMHNSADAVLLIRALHNLARFSDPAKPESNFLQQAIDDTFAVLKPGGILGIVQHEARDNMPDAWANGSAGYLKKAFVIAQMEQAGFEYVASSDINSNDRDQPTADDIVWRLPPTLATSGNNETLAAEMKAIGESNRMTLKFIKPNT